MFHVSRAKNNYIKDNYKHAQHFNCRRGLHLNLIIPSEVRATPTALAVRDRYDTRSRCVAITPKNVAGLTSRCGRVIRGCHSTPMLVQQ